MSEKCIRCGNIGEDRRTLWMACFYEMSELDVPFEQHTLFHANLEDLTKSKEATVFDNGSGGRQIVLETGKFRSSGNLTPMQLHTLRVCKRCRAEWMGAIESWFKAEPQGVDHDADDETEESCGSGIFIRVNGSIQEVTRHEWGEMQKRRVE